MGNLDYKQFAERHRPHIHLPDAILFVTYRLAGSIPKTTVGEYRAKKEWLENELKRVRKLAPDSDAPAVKHWPERVQEFNREWFLKFEEFLHQANSGPMWMKDERVANAIAEGLHRLDGDAYRLDAYSVMSNHVHTVFKPLLTQSELREDFDEDGHLIFTSDHPSLSRIMHSLKGASARACNLILSRTGQFWEHESFDHVIRKGKFYRTLRYVLNNPVKAGLVGHWRDWPWNYCRKELSDKL